MNSIAPAQQQLQELIELIKKLRAPDGCPWDQKQTMQDLGRYLLDETHEVLDALSQNEPYHLQEELGDLLFLILFITEIAAESGQFLPADVLKNVKEKMIRRHPHVFSEVAVNSVEDIKNNWEKIKKKERGGKTDDDNLFRSVPRSLPALKKAQKITEIAAGYGFDWPKTEDVLQKLQEELAELALARQNNNTGQIEEEIGDILFTVANISRFLAVDSEKALNLSLDKFLRRFDYMAKQLAARKQPLRLATPGDLDALWNEAKEKGI